MSILESEHVSELLARAGLDGLGPRTLRVALGATLVIVAIGLWRFWPAAPAPESSFDEAQAGGRASSQPSEEASSGAAAEVVVHVAGAVMRPGVYALATGSRVADAIAAAGGGLGGAALDSLNLARILADGEQVYVLTAEQVESGAGGPPAAPGASATKGAAGKVDINQASAADLEALPGVGPSTAQKIVDDRETNGPFAAPEDLMRVPGIGAKKFEALREYVSCG